jgi:hypothetical protein
LKPGLGQNQLQGQLKAHPSAGLSKVFEDQLQLGRFGYGDRGREEFA